MKWVIACLVLGATLVGAWFFWSDSPMREFTQAKFGANEFCTLEIRYSPDDILKVHSPELLKNPGYKLLEPKLLFIPYLMMDVKYTKDYATTGEGTLLWGLTDGEMVLNTCTWEKTHGYKDCFAAKADKNDFKLLKALIENGGAIEREHLYSCFKVNPEVLDEWIESCREKKLLVASGNTFRLHFQNPRLEMQPVTQIDHPLVTQTATQVPKVKKTYTPQQIQKMLQSVFGEDFAVKKSQEVFLPIYQISIQNPDGTVLTTYWNGVNGRRVEDPS